MLLLKISDNVGYFLLSDGSFQLIDKITKEDLLRLADFVLGEEEIELEEYDDQKIKNQAHQIIYKSIYNKFVELRARRQEFVDESARLYLEDYQRYRQQFEKSGSN